MLKENTSEFRTTVTVLYWKLVTISRLICSYLSLNINNDLLYFKWNNSFKTILGELDFRHLNQWSISALWQSILILADCHLNCLVIHHRMISKNTGWVWMTKQMWINMQLPNQSSELAVWYLNHYWTSSYVSSNSQLNNHQRFHLANKNILSQQFETRHCQKVCNNTTADIQLSCYKKSCNR